jgi:putative transposase
MQLFVHVVVTVCHTGGIACADNRNVKRMERVRLYATASQTAHLEKMLDVSRQVYNAALEHRIGAYRRGARISGIAQYREFTEIRREDARLQDVYREVIDAALHRLDLAYAAFFRRVKRGDTPGFPRFRSAHRLSTLEFPHGDRALKLNAAQDRVKIPGVGTLRLRKGRVIGAFGRAFVTRRAGRWYAQFECEREVEALPETGRRVGIDVGTALLAAPSQGEPFELPPTIAALERRRTVAQLKLSRTKKRSKRRGKARAALARAHERVANARRDALHKISRTIVNTYDVIALEDLRIRNMVRSAKGTVEEPGTNVAAKSGLNREIHNASWGTFRQLIVEKAACAARRVILVNPKNTSRTCSACGHVSAESRRSQAEFVCVSCGFSLNADVNAARVILQRAELQLAASGAAQATPDAA